MRLFSRTVGFTPEDPRILHGYLALRNTHPHRITIGPEAKGYCRVLEGGGGSYELGCTPVGSGFRVQGPGFRVQGSGFGVQGAGCRVQG